jgi:hypothetical protein
MQLKPGWLAPTVHAAHMRVLRDHDPSSYIPTKPPIHIEEAKELSTMMAKRFEEWTGLSLKDFL